MNMKQIKKLAKRAWQRFSNLRPLYFLLITLILGGICIAALRQNNEHMAQLKTAVYQADKANGNVQQTLDNLQAYVTSHMNTNLSTGKGTVYPPIQLHYTYLRLVASEEQSSISANAGLYTAAQSYCQALDPLDFSGRNRVPCIEQYVTSHGASVATIPTSLYEFDFVTPSWSPDLAGWSLLLTIVSLAVTALLYSVQFTRKFLAEM